MRTGVTSYAEFTDFTYRTFKLYVQLLWVSQKSIWVGHGLIAKTAPADVLTIIVARCNDTVCCGHSRPSNEVFPEDFNQRPFHSTTIVREFDATYFSFKMGTFAAKLG